ncbi:splicing factor [Friedmanniomyces endolithicus]|nr:splicing factor [Friedmanniomyces endolithicus]
MAAEQRRLLEQLMGDQLLSAQPGSYPKQPALTLSDPKVCRSYVAGACPHDLFTNTKQDLGTCPKTHQPNLKEEYQALPDDERKALGFDWDYSRDIGRYVGDCDRRIDQAQRRLEKTVDEVRQTNTLLKQISDLTRTLEDGILEVQILAEEGAVNMAVQEHHKLKGAKVQKEDRERDLKVLWDTGRGGTMMGMGAGVAMEDAAEAGTVAVGTVEVVDLVAEEGEVEVAAGVVLAGLGLGGE